VMVHIVTFHWQEGERTVLGNATAVRSRGFEAGTECGRKRAKIIMIALPKNQRIDAVILLPGRHREQSPSCALHSCMVEVLHVKLNAVKLMPGACNG
jgi:hypothetical protein